MKKIISFFTLIVMLFLPILSLPQVVNADLTTKKVRVMVTYPVSDTSLGVDAGALVHEPYSGILFRFLLKNSGGTTLCVEEKTMPVVNGIITYELGSQYAINRNGVSTGCNMDSLINKTSYKIIVLGDLNKNNNFNDSIDYTSEEAIWKESSSQQFEESFLDSKTLSMQQNIGTSGASTVNNSNNISLNKSSQEMSAEMIINGKKSKTFDLDKDGVAEVFVKDGTDDGIIYRVNKSTEAFENIYTKKYITLDDNSNIYVSGKDSNSLIFGSFGTNINLKKTNIGVNIYSMKRGIVTETSNTLLEFQAGVYFTMNVNGIVKKFIYDSEARQYNEQISVNFGSTSDLYSSTVDPLWTSQDFSSDVTDYYGGEVRELEVNGYTVSDIDGTLYGDFNKDNKLDFIAYKNSTNGKAYFNVYLQISPGKYKEVLDNQLGDSITAGVSVINNSSDFGKDINEIVIIDGKTNYIYKINKGWETKNVGISSSDAISRIGVIEGDFMEVIGKTGGVENKDVTYFTIGNGFNDTKPSRVNDMFLVSGNFKVEKDGYDLYDYFIYKWNGTSFEKLKMNNSDFKFTGSKIGFKKIGISDFGVFYVDQSTNYTSGKQDKTNLFYIYDSKIFPIALNIVLNDKQTSTSHDGLGEGGFKLLGGSKFGFFEENINDDTGLFSINKANYSTVYNKVYKTHDYIEYVDGTLNFDGNSGGNSCGGHCALSENQDYIPNRKWFSPFSILFFTTRIYNEY